MNLKITCKTNSVAYKYAIENNIEYVEDNSVSNVKISYSTTDITKLKKHIIKKEALEDCYERAGNVNEDTKISVTDLAKLKKAIVGLITL